MNLFNRASARFALLACAMVAGCSTVSAAPPVVDHSQYNQPANAAGVSGTLPSGVSTNSPTPGVNNTLPPGVSNKPF